MAKDTKLTKLKAQRLARLIGTAERPKRSGAGRFAQPVLTDHRTGERVRVDPVKARLSRLQRRLHAWAAIVSDAVRDRPHRLVMVTLTYATADLWRPGHIRDYIKALRSQHAGALLGYAWVAELQQRGALHYHVLLVLQPGARVDQPDTSGAWPYGLSRVEVARTLYYVATYSGKEYQKAFGAFPKGARAFAVWVSSALVGGRGNALLRSTAFPAWARRAIPEGVDHIRRVRGGVEIAGVFMPSPFVLAGFADELTDELQGPAINPSEWARWLHGSDDIPRVRYPEHVQKLRAKMA